MLRAASSIALLLCAGHSSSLPVGRNVTMETGTYGDVRSNLLDSRVVRLYTRSEEGVQLLSALGGDVWGATADGSIDVRIPNVRAAIALHCGVCTAKMLAGDGCRRDGACRTQLQRHDRVVGRQVRGFRVRACRSACLCVHVPVRESERVCVRANVRACQRASV